MYQLGFGLSVIATASPTQLALTAKTPAFGWMDLKEGDIKDGKLVKDPTEDDLESIKSVLVGFYDCGHARKLQHSIQGLHKQVKKGG